MERPSARPLFPFLGTSIFNVSSRFSMYLHYQQAFWARATSNNTGVSSLYDYVNLKTFSCFFSENLLRNEMYNHVP